MNLRVRNHGDLMLVLRWEEEIPRIERREESFSLRLVVGVIKEEVDKVDLQIEEQSRDLIRIVHQLILEASDTEEMGDMKEDMTTKIHISVTAEGFKMEDTLTVEIRTLSTISSLDTLNIEDILTQMTT